MESDLGLWPRISAFALGSRAQASDLELCRRIADSSLGSRISTCLVQASSHAGCPPPPTQWRPSCHTLSDVLLSVAVTPLLWIGADSGLWPRISALASISCSGLGSQPWHRISGFDLRSRALPSDLGLALGSRVLASDLKLCHWIADSSVGLMHSKRGSARPGAHGAAQLRPCAHSTARLGPGVHGAARLGSARPWRSRRNPPQPLRSWRGSARLGSALALTTRLGSDSMLLSCFWSLLRTLL